MAPIAAETMAPGVVRVAEASALLDLVTRRINGERRRVELAALDEGAAEQVVALGEPPGPTPRGRDVGHAPARLQLRDAGQRRAGLAEAGGAQRRVVLDPLTPGGL